MKKLGLTEQQVLDSRRRHGDNVLTPPPRKSLWAQFVEKFDDPLIKILLVALALSVGISSYELLHLDQGWEVLLEPLGIVIAVVLATLVGFLVEVNANKKFELLNRTNDDVLFKVMRNGHVTQVPRRDIVVGDIVILDTGERVPADGRLTQSVWTRARSQASPWRGSRTLYSLTVTTAMRQPIRPMCCCAGRR